MSRVSRQEATRKRHREFAPQPTDPNIIPSIYWIEIEEWQKVEWRWTELPDGNRVVTGYQVVPRNAPDLSVTDGGAGET